MIAYRVEIWCEGCGVHYEHSMPHQDISYCPILVRNLVELAQKAGWSVHYRGVVPSHVCPRCEKKRRASVQACVPSLGGKSVDRNRIEESREQTTKGARTNEFRDAD